MISGKHFNRLNGGIACCAVALILGVLALAANADLLAFQAARPCAAQEPTADGCYAWVAGRVVGIGVTKMEANTGPGRVDVDLTLDLPSGQRTARVATTFLPAGKPHVGDLIDAKLWRGQVTDVRVAGVTVGVVSRPVTRYLLLAYAAGLAFVVGLLMLVGYAIDRRTGHVR